MFSVGCGTEMSAYRIDIRRLILSSTLDFRASVLARFTFREEGCFWSLGPVDLPVRRDVGCAGAMAPIPTGARPPCLTGATIVVQGVSAATIPGRALDRTPDLPFLLTCPASWHSRMSTGSRELRRPPVVVRGRYPLIALVQPRPRRFFVPRVSQDHAGIYS